MRRLSHFRRLVLGLLVVTTGGCALPTDDLATPPRPREGVRAGGALTVAITPPAGVDPLSYYEPSAMLVGSVLCETLVTIDPDSGRIQSGLAEKWQVADEGSRLVFQLRKDAYFHDGHQVRAADVVESLKRLANPEYASHAAPLLSEVAGYATFRQAVDEGLQSPEFLGLRVIEPFSFEVSLIRRRPEAVRLFAHPALAPMSKAPYDADPAAAPMNPQCAGPYRLASPFTRGAGELVLHRAERYSGGVAAFTGGGKGYVDEIRFRVYGDAAAAYRAYERGEVDVAGVPPADVAEALNRFGPRVLVGDSPHVEFVAITHIADSPFANRDLRKALSLALDRTTITRAVYGASRRPASGFIPPALVTTPAPPRGRKKPVEIRFGCSNVPENADRERASRLWDSAAADLGESLAKFHAEPLKLYFNSDYGNERLAQEVARQWGEAFGLNVVPTAMPWDQYVQQGTVGRGFDGAFRMSYEPPYSSVAAFLRPLFHSGAGAETNMARYSSRPFDEALEKDAASVVDDDERRIRYREVEDLLCNDMPMIPVAFDQTHYVVRERVSPARENGRLVSLDGAVLLREMTLN